MSLTKVTYEMTTLSSIIDIQNTSGTSPNLGIVIGDTTYLADAIGDGSVLIGGDKTTSKNKITGVLTNLRYLLGGYDCTVGAALASGIVGSHHSTIADGVTHGAIFGGSYNALTAGNYSVISGTGNSIASDSSVIAGGTSNSIAAGATSSGILGGASNTITGGLRGTIAGGSTNTISGNDTAIVGGVGNNVSGGYNIGGGSTNTISGNGNFGFGLSNTITTSYGAVWGRSNTVSKDYASAHGYRAVARSPGGLTTAGGYIAADGDAQFTESAIRGSTTSNTNVYLTGADNNQFCLVFPSNNFAATVTALLTAVEPATGASKSIKVEALVKRIGGVNTLVGGAATITVIAADAAAAAWTVSAFSLSTNNMRIGVSGDVGKTIRWAGKVTAVEVSF